MKKLLLTVLLLMAGYSLLLAQKNVSGKVTDKKDGAPIAGVSVTVKGTALVVQTNAQGEFTLTGIAGNSTLIFTNVSYKTLETKVGTGNTINVILEEDSKQLSEVVVTANAIKREAKSLGSVSYTHLDVYKRQCLNHR